MIDLIPKCNHIRTSMCLQLFYYQTIAQQLNGKIVIAMHESIALVPTNNVFIARSHV